MPYVRRTRIRRRVPVRAGRPRLYARKKPPARRRQLAPTLRKSVEAVIQRNLEVKTKCVTLNTGSNGMNIPGDGLTLPGTITQGSGIVYPNLLQNVGLTQGVNNEQVVGVKVAVKRFLIKFQCVVNDISATNIYSIPTMVHVLFYRKKLDPLSGDPSTIKIHGNTSVRIFGNSYDFMKSYNRAEYTICRYKCFTLRPPPENVYVAKPSNTPTGAQLTTLNPNSGGQNLKCFYTYTFDVTKHIAKSLKFTPNNMNIPNNTSLSMGIWTSAASGISIPKAQNVARFFADAKLSFTDA